MTPCQDAHAVSRQQAEAASEIDVLDRILAAFDTALQVLDQIKKGQSTHPLRKSPGRARSGQRGSGHSG